MITGSQGTFVISWTQTEIDGLEAAPRGALGVGSGWRWSGEAVRIDGPQHVLALTGAEGEAEVRARVARKVGKMLGRLIAPSRTGVGRGPDFGDPLLQRGFDVTDGFRAYTVTLVDLGASQPPLLLFIGAVPPANTDLWVVRAQMEVAEVNRLSEQPTGVICFTPGTRIRTERGDVAVENIAEGDRIQTKDNGIQEVLWKGEKRITGARLYAMPELRPIRLRAGALGQDRPDDDLVVSPAHRLLVKGAKARALFNTDEVLVAARDLVNDRTVVRDLTLTSVLYVHLLLPHHEVVFANGLETESFHPAGEALASVDAAQRARLVGLMPELGEDPMAYGDHARRALNRAEAAILSSPHA
ncbi:MAG: hemolysin-type calcium-binding protein [Rhodobacterales bacterium CG2_30_65_12]|nr:MAG: hemolysin-type calcium-binding protein [Rhodobacterales bacterium CG2_30_65_12]